MRDTWEGSYIKLTPPSGGYGPDTSRFVAEAWPDYTRPMFFNAWLYSYANPVNLTDPSGKDVYWPVGELKAIAELKPDILASVKRHNTSNTNMDDASFAAFMTAILHWEGKLPGNAKPKADRINDCLGDLAAQLIGYDASTGIANIRPSVALEILRGQIPGVNGVFDYQIEGGSTPNMVMLQSTLASVGQGSWFKPEQVLYYELQNPQINLEYLAANTQRGADRITALGYQASVFNLAAWANAGVQTPLEFAEPGVGPKGQSYGNVILDTMPKAFEVLFGPGFVGRYLAYNPDEARFVDPWLREPEGCNVVRGPC